MRRLSITLVLLALSACKSDPTSLLLAIASDLPAASLRAVEIAIAENPDAGFVDGSSSSTCVCIDPSCPSPPTLPLLVPLEPGKQGTGNFMIEVRAHKQTGCSDTSYLTDQAVTRFQTHEKLVVSMALNLRCIGVMCNVGETCDPDTGNCVTNVQTGSMPDLLPPPAIDQSVPQDLSVSTSADMAAPPSMPFAIGPAPDSWDVAANDTSFTLVQRTDDKVSWGTVANDVFTQAGAFTSTDKIGEVCAARVGGGSSSFIYGTSETSSTTGKVSVFTSASDVTLLSSSDQSAGSLQCATAKSGVTVAWLTGPLLHSGSTSLVAAAVDPTMVMTMPTAQAIASTSKYALSNARLPAEVAFGVAPSNAMTGTDLADLELYYLNGMNPGPIGLDSSYEFAVAGSGFRLAFVGTDSAGAVVFGGAKSLGPFSMEVAPLVALAPTGDTTFAIAVLSTGNSTLEVYRADLMNVTTTVDPVPVQITKSAATDVRPRLVATTTQLLVTWLDDSAMPRVLMGQILPLP